MGITVIYASQTGTAKYYAQQCVKALWSRGLDPTLLDIRSLTVDMLSNLGGVVLFVVATSGQGQMTVSATPFWRLLLNANLSNNHLSTLKYSILGLGDSSYQHFNYAAKKLHRRLEQLGAQQVIVRQFADEQSAQGIDDGYASWMKSVFEYFQVGNVNIREGFMYDVVAVDLDTTSMNLEVSTVTRNDRITPDGYEKDVRVVTIRCPDTIAQERPGDIALLYPHSQDEDVSLLCDRLDINPHKTYQLTAVRPDAPYKTWTITCHQLFKHHFDIYSPLTRSALQVLSEFCNDSTSAEKLRDLALSDYELYLDYIVRPKRTPLEVFHDFPAIERVPLEALFDIFPAIRPRSFSLASFRHGAIDLCVALVRYKSPFLNKSAADREGLASRCISRLSVGDPVSILIEPGDISMVDPHKFKSIVLMGAGTGVAPLRSIVQYIHGSHRKMPIDIYYGCRSVSKDCLFKEEWQMYENVQFYSMGSRDIEGPRQHLDALLKLHKERLLPLLLDPTCLFVLSGNNHLPTLVKSTLDSIVGANGFADMLSRTGRLVIECWP